MAKKKFANHDEHSKAVHTIKWGAHVSHESWAQEMQIRIARAKEAHHTSSLDDAAFLLKLFIEKLDEHNGRCKQQAGRMETFVYKRANIQE